MTDNPPAEIYVNQMEDRVTFRIKTRYYLALLIPETMKVLGSTKSKITKDEKGENVPCLEITDVVLAHCNIPKQQLSRVWYTFAANKSFGWLLDILSTNFIILKTFVLEFS